MGQVWKGKATKAARTRLQTVAKHEASMRSGVRCRMMAAAETFRAERSDFDAEYEEEDWLEPEAEIARFLGDFSARSD
jgi:hypothetical protein